MRFAVLPGDDIGPEITDAALSVVRAVDTKFGLNLKLDVYEVGMSVHRKIGTTLPPEVVEAARNADGVLLGPGGMTAYPSATEGGINIPGTIRKQLDLFANIRPARSRPGVPKAHPGLDCVIVRENTEGFYADRNMFQGNGEFMPTPDSAIALRLITAKASRRIAEVAFKIARTRRKHVTVVGKRHVLQVTDGLFMREVDKVAAQYPDVKLREIDVDAIAAELYTKPAAFDVILTTNMFGDILSNLINALAGGLGMASALNVGETHAAANAGHGSAPDIAGKGIANPIGLILSAAALLNHLGLKPGAEAFASAGQAIEKAVDTALANAESRTGDLEGTAGTQAVAEAICRYIREAN
ncbi:tartrate dehydrogenase [Caballeronia udeis]|uniref:Tartrate dehydrogenase n=1 Tax=Caballeronia udeis TaxID=1232866 RepID=A0A158K0H2_9BURK|nr:isocitrate/isopropylmalate dehydrogenase family protein [Caballeronia udeis]SAL74061.1 tartrate dehydrogenase [Caballeronia udeis]